MEIIKLGSMVVDSTTGMKGMVTKLDFQPDGFVYYVFQPSGLSPDNGLPVDGFWGVPSRFVGGERVAAPEIPLGVLGTKVEDLATGFKGKVVSLTLHMSGCLHASVQPAGKCAKTGGAFPAAEFDLRRLKGPAIPVLTEEEVAADQRKKPSPGAPGGYSPAASTKG